MFRPAAGSSSSSSFGSAARARAISTARCWPKARLVASMSAQSAMPSRSSSSSERARMARSSLQVEGRASRPEKNPARLCTCRPTMTHSSAVMPWNSLMFWKVRAMPRRAIWCGLRPWISSPWKRMVPALTGRLPAMRLNRVVLPAPFGPITALILPAGTPKLTSLTACRPPNRLCTALSSSRGALMTVSLAANHAGFGAG